MRKREQGFTLMELMVVIVIVAILAAVAVPLYVNYVKDAQRTEAKGAIGAVITAEQTYFQINGQYVGDTFVPDPGGKNAGQQKLNCDLTDALNNWDIKAALNGTDGFTVTATGKAPQAGGRLVIMTYSRSTGAKWNDNDQPVP
jgi:prepilin-type N-terminal cleavage/methylation domain-containing protein